MQSVNILLINIVVKLFSLIPFRLLYLFSDGAFFLLYHILRYRRKVVLKNLSNSFPHKSENEIQSISKKYYRHLCDLIFESLKGLSLPRETWSKRFKYINPDIFPKYKSALLLGSHFGNWEWGVLSFPLVVSHTVLGIYKPLNNKGMDSFLNRLRKRWGLHLSPMARAGRAVYEYRNRPTLFVLINDQTPSDVVNAHWLPFLNQDTPFLQGADKLAQKTGMPVFYFEIEKIKRGFYEVTFSKLAEEKEKLTKSEITRRYAQALEKTILAKPEYWLWSHKRWKRKRPPIKG